MSASTSKEWLITLRVRSDAALAGADVQEWAQQQARFLSEQETIALIVGQSRWAGIHRFEVAAICTPGGACPCEDGGCDNAP